MYKNLKSLKKDLETKDDKFWLREGEKMALRLFHLASVRVPAYKDFLKKNKIKSEKIKTIADFSLIPPVDKKNYLTAYPIEKLCWNGDISSAEMISLSSGSSGEPFFWLRRTKQEVETMLTHELFMLDSFKIDKRSTLCVVSFSMGMWVAGTLTYRALQDIAVRYRMTVITPGINKNDVLNVIQRLGPKFEQVIIAGYPPFVKDIIDEGESMGMNWKKFNVKFLFAAEAFSEKWRDHIYSKVGAKDAYKDSLNIFGTADALILGHETPLSIQIRRTAVKNKALYKSIFNSEDRIPTLTQYNPTLRFFENAGDNFVFSCFSGMPLVRYNIGDSGRVIEFGKMEGILADYGVNMNKEAQKNNINFWKLPFLYVFGRSDFTASFYGINIYPENIRDGLSDDKVNEFVSGKFTMLTKTDTKMDQYLELNVELKSHFSKIPLNLEPIVKETLTSTLKAKSTEYNELYKYLGKKAEPMVNLCLYNDGRFFKSGVKQKWHKI